MRTDIELPEEVRKELAFYKGEGAEYSARDLVISYMAHDGGHVTSNDLITYVWRVKKTVVKRTYLYQMLYTLRKAGIIKNAGGRRDGLKTFQITHEGRQSARPFVKPDVK